MKTAEELLPVITQERDQFRAERDQLRAKLAEYEKTNRWREFPAPSLDRIFVAGVQPRSGMCIAYWYLSEDVTDEKGVPMEYPGAIRWQPIPKPPTENCEQAALAAIRSRMGGENE